MLGACLCMADGMRTMGTCSPLHLSSASCPWRVKGLQSFPPMLPSLPISAIVTSSLTYLRAIFPAIIKPLQTCGWPCVCLCRRWECACARVCWDEKVALCSRQSRSEDETIKHVREDMRETALRTESDSKSENEKVLVWDGVRVRKEERERSYSQPSCMCLMSITSFNQEKYVCIQIKHKTPLLPGALLPCLFVLLQAAC